MLELYLVFAYIGLIAFGGGYVILPLIQSFIVNNYHWVSDQTLIDIISISQITPGPIAINAATFIGMSQNGLIGSTVATLGVITPQIIILLFILKFIGLENSFMNKVVDGIKPATISLIFIATINIAKTSFFKEDVLQYRAVICFGVALILSKFKIKFVYIILICAILGLIL